MAAAMGVWGVAMGKCRELFASRESRGLNFEL